MTESPLSDHDLEGACHCGKVRVRIPSQSAGVVTCFCADCQKLHGNAFALLAAPRQQVRWEGEEAIQWYASSEANERSFCRFCGSRLAKRPKQGDRIMVSAGLFGRDLARRTTRNLWLEHKPAWAEAQRLGPPTPEELVSLALSGPIESEVAKYGYSMRVASGNPAPPRVIALTWITGQNEAERERIRAHSRQNVADFLKEPGFLSIVTGFIGLRGFTVTAWEDEASLRRALGHHHQVAMNELFSQNFVDSVWTSVWTPTRINRLWVRCRSCGSLEDASAGGEACQTCSARLPPRPAYW